MNIEPDRLYPIQDTAPYTGRGITSTYAEINKGNLTATKVGSRTFIQGSELLRYRDNLPTIGRKPEKVKLEPRLQEYA